MKKNYKILLKFIFGSGEINAEIVNLYYSAETCPDASGWSILAESSNIRYQS